MEDEKLYAVLNEKDYFLGAYTSEWEAQLCADIFTKNNRGFGDLNSTHRIVEYTRSPK